MPKQVPADEREPTRDESSLKPGSHALPSPTLAVSKSISEWDRWVDQQKRLAELTADMEVVEEGDVPKYEKRRPKSARSPKSARAGKEKTEARLAVLEAAKAKNDAEVEELKRLLGRTLYTGGGNGFQRAGNVATAGLRKLNDGQADSIADLRRRRVAEDLAALECRPEGTPPWDSTPMHYCPPALKGCIPITPEPWARDQLAYEQGMQGHGATNSTAMNYEVTGSTKKHVSMIVNDMDKYRRELGSGKATPSSARVNRAWNTATPRTTPGSGRYSTRRSSRKNTGRSPNSPGAEEEEPARIVITERQARVRERLLEAQATGHH